MPQMAPMNWLYLFLMFTLIFIILNSSNYFISQKNIPIKINKNSNFSMNWKW